MGEGWSFIDRKFDDYDVEWMSWKETMRNFWICFVTHSVAAEIYRKFFKLKVSYDNIN